MCFQSHKLVKCSLRGDKLVYVFRDLHLGGIAVFYLSERATLMFGGCSYDIH
jgi:hypothetical protein